MILFYSFYKMCTWKGSMAIPSSQHCKHDEHMEEKEDIVAQNLEPTRQKGAQFPHA